MRYTKPVRADVVVVGGGAAGMLAAAEAALRGFSVVLLERNRDLGRKLRITGKGRCNITNSCDIKDFMANVPGNGKFLYGALNRLSPADTMGLFENLGVPLKVERGNRVFPVSDDANDVAECLVSYLADAGVELKRTSARSILTGNGAVRAVTTEAGEIPCKNVIIATGGASYPGTGSTGDGWKMAEELGHSVVVPRPSLVPLEVHGDTCSRLMGLSLRNVKLSVFEDGKSIFSDFGELLFTHFGMSGPLILSASAHMRRIGSSEYTIEIDLKPALDEAVLDKRVLSDFAKHKNNDFINALGELLPKKLIPVVVSFSGIDPREKVNSVTREQRQELLRVLKHFPVSVSGARPISEAIVTSGGIRVGEIDPKTMESKLVKGLYFAGEVIDVDAYTGGFNLQIAWSTAYTAAHSLRFD